MPNEKLMISGLTKIDASNKFIKLELINGDNKKGMDAPANNAGMMLAKNIIIIWKKYIVNTCEFLPPKDFKTAIFLIFFNR